MRLSYFTAVFAGFVVPVALLSGSCGLVLDDFQKVPEAAVDAGVDADDGCKSVTYPPPPDAGPEGVDGGSVVFTVGIRTIDLGESAPKDKPVGVDLDNICTCLGEGASCKYPSYATADHCDKPGGVDNAATGLFASLSLALGAEKFGSSYYSQKAEQGFWTLLARVSNFNGTPNDPKVTFAFYSPQGLESSAAGAGGAGGAGPCKGGGGGVPGTIPCWNGDDVWRVADSSLTPGGTIDTPLYADENAYVTDNVLVANISDTIIDLGGGANNYMGIKLTAGTVTAVLDNSDPDGLGWRVKSGTIAGRWRTADLFGNLGKFVAQGQTLCTDTPFVYDTFKSQVCKYVDVSSKLGGATLECDSISFGMNFTAFPVKFGSIGQTIPPTSHCLNGNDPAMDSCGP